MIPQTQPATPGPTTEGQVLRPPDGLRWVKPVVVPTPPPLMPLAVALGLGIALDHVLNIGKPELAGPFALAVALTIMALQYSGLNPKLIHTGIILAVIILGAGWQNHCWNSLAADDLARDPQPNAQPVWLQGVPTSVPEYRPGLNPDDEGTTRFELDVVSRNSGRAWRPTSGRLLVLTGGKRTDIQMGYPVFVAGTLEPMRGPRNPGEADLAARWRARGVRLRLNTEGLESIRPDADGTVWAWQALIGHIRTSCQERLIEGLRPDVAALASALLLGRYDAVDQETFADFSRTGTTHILAISGLHMQALATVLGFTLTVVGVGRKPAALIVIIATLAYTLVVGPMPSVVRSAAMTVVVALAVICDYPVRSANVLALAALITLGFNPAFLFDAGCQLSFIAVGALFWLTPPAAAFFGYYSHTHPEPDPTTPGEWLDRLELQLAPWYRRYWRKITRWLMLMLIASVVVWLITLPIIVWAFHLVPLVGSLLNVPLVALSMPTLVSVVVLIPAGWFGPFRDLARRACESLLSPQREAVTWAADLPGAFTFAAAPPNWLVLLFYGTLGITLALACYPGKWRNILGMSTALAAYLGMVLCVILPSDPDSLEAEVLAVDHGLSVLIRAPSGKTLVYDCGRMRDPHVGARVIAPALWHSGARLIDTLVLSHADADHYSGLLDLLDRFTVREICVPPGFEAPSNPGLAEVMAECRASGILVRELVAGDMIDLGPGVTCTVLHPAADFPADRPDNEHSLILNIQSEQRSMLLTGDLEGEGLARLLSQPSHPIEAILAPHHGSQAANPESLYRWANPRLILISQRRPAFGSGELPEWFAENGRATLTTWERGAIQIQWTNSGLTAHGFLDE